MARSNLFYGGRGYPQTPSRGRGVFLGDRTRIAAQYSMLPQHPDTEAGRQAYTQQVQDWHGQHGATAMPNTDRPYPLKPGTAPLGSRECFACGMNTAPFHQSTECTNNALPAQESRWREIVSRLAGHMAGSAFSPPAAVQYVAPTSIPPSYYPSLPTYPGTPGYLEPSYYGQQAYEGYPTYHDLQGNDYGLQQ